MEGTGPAGWIASLALVGDTTGLTGVDLLGQDALNFAARLDLARGIVVLTPAAPLDYEAFAPAGRLPEATFGLRFGFADGSSAESGSTFHVTVLNRDDTPPSALAFAGGGSVAAGAIGATIGTLAVTDADSAGPFLFSFTEDDAWRFEVVGSTLKLKDGITLGLDDIPDRPVIIQVSDAFQSAAFTLDIAVTAPADPWSGSGPATLPALPDGTVGGFALVDAATVLALRDSSVVRLAAPVAGDLRHVALTDGTEFWVAQHAVLRFADGVMDYRTDGPAALAAALSHAVLGAPLCGPALARLVAQAEAGAAWTDLAGTLLAGAAPPASNAAFVTALYDAALGHDPDAAALATHLGHLAAGASRAQVAVDIALGAEARAVQAAGTDGFWLPDALGCDAAWRGDTGGPAAAAPAPALDAGWFL